MSEILNPFRGDGKRVVEQLYRRCKEYFKRQIALAAYPLFHCHTTPMTDLTATFSDNREVWKQFNEEHLYDTHRVKLEYFHLFEWFPQSPGIFHTNEGETKRRWAMDFWRDQPGKKGYFELSGKLLMLEGGIGAVRLRPRKFQGDEYYFMTASSNDICHEGFPVVLPRRFYSGVKECINKYGAAPATISGEMRYIPADIFGTRRDIPSLYLHVDDVQLLARPRSEITRFWVSAAVVFTRLYDYYATYATFDPASTESIENACVWMQDFYIKELHQGQVLTDFDEIKPRFPDAVFALPKVMNGKLDPRQTQRVSGFSGEQITIINNHIQGDYIAGNITVGDIYGSNITIGHGSSQTG